MQKYKGIDTCMPQDNPFNDPDTLTKKIIKPNIQSQLTENEKSGRKDVIMFLGPSGCGKTTLAFMLAAEEYAIYTEVPDTANKQAVYGDGLGGFLADVKTACLLYPPMESPNINRDKKCQLAVQHNVAARALVLLSLLYHKKVSSPMDWLLGQIDGFSTYISEVYLQLRGFLIDEILVNKLLDDISKITGKRLLYILDECQLLMDFRTYGTYSVPKFPNKTWTLMQLFESEIASLNISPLYLGTHLHLDDHFRLASAVAKLENPWKIYVLLWYDFSSTSEEVERALTTCLDLSQAKPETLETICQTIIGRKRFVSTFIRFFIEGPQNNEDRRKRLINHPEFNNDLDAELLYVLKLHSEWTINSLSNNFGILLQDGSHTMNVYAQLAAILMADLVGGIEGKAVTTNSVPILKHCIVPLDAEDQKLIMMEKEESLTSHYKPLPLEPYFVSSVHQIFKEKNLSLYRTLFKQTTMINTSQGRSSQLDLLVAMRILELEGTNVAEFIKKLIGDLNYKFPGWFPINAQFQSKRIINERDEGKGILSPFMYQLAEHFVPGSMNNIERELIVHSECNLST